MLRVYIGVFLHAICKYNMCSAQDKDIRSRYKCIGGDDYFVAGIQACEQSAHFKGIGTRCGEQAMPEPIPFFEKFMTQFSVFAISRDMTRVHCIVNIMNFSPCHVGLVEGYPVCLFHGRIYINLVQEAVSQYTVFNQECEMVFKGGVGATPHLLKKIKSKKHIKNFV